MDSLRVKCPAKINLTLEVVNKRDDGFHNIKSVMQLIDLYDFLNISVQQNRTTQILLTGKSKEIPYDSSNLIYKAAEIFLTETGIDGYNICIDIEKHIPVSAGLAGGSTDAAGTIYGLNKIFNNPLGSTELNKLCARLGSDLNVCLNGGCILATSRGEVTKKINTIQMPVTLIKPVDLGISAKYAYERYSQKEIKPHNNMTEKILSALKNGDKISPFLYNDLEYAVFDDFIELKEIKKEYPDAIMSGSGSTYFVLRDTTNKLGDKYLFIRNLKFIDNGVAIDN